MGSITAPGNPFLCSTPPTFPRTWCIKSEGITKDIGVCYNKTITHNYGLWRAENPILFSLPTFMTQLACILFVNRLLMALFRKLHLPRISAEILVSNHNFIYLFILKILYQINEPLSSMLSFLPVL